MTPDRISASGIIVLKSESVDTNRVSGNATSRVYTGSKQAMINQRQVELGFGATTTKIESQGDGNYQLTAGYTYDAWAGSTVEPPANVHELETSMEQVDSLASDVLRGQLYTSFGSYAGMTGALNFLKCHIEQYSQSIAVKDADAVAILQKVEDEFDIYSGAQLTLMLNLFRGIAIHEQKFCTQFNTIYRRRITAASYNQAQAGFTGVGKIWTTNEILSFENVPSAWWFQLPASYVWFKGPPQVSSVAGQKTEISYHYIGAVAAWNGTNAAYNAATLLGF